THVLRIDFRQGWREFRLDLDNARPQALTLCLGFFRRYRDAASQRFLQHREGRAIDAFAKGFVRSVALFQRVADGLFDGVQETASPGFGLPPCGLGNLSVKSVGKWSSCLQQTKPEVPPISQYFATCAA